METKKYQITFKAELSEDDLRAMNKCFYDAMEEAMQIKPCWDLKLELLEDNPEPKLEELLKTPMSHISQVKACFEACKSSSDVYRVIDCIPGMFGDFAVQFDNELSGFEVTNSYYDGMLNDYYDDYYWFDYPEDWEYSDEEAD